MITLSSLYPISFPFLLQCLNGQKALSTSTSVMVGLRRGFQECGARIAMSPSSLHSYQLPSKRLMLPCGLVGASHLFLLVLLSRPYSTTDPAIYGDTRTSMSFFQISLRYANTAVTPVLGPSVHARIEDTSCPERLLETL